MEQRVNAWKRRIIAQVDSLQERLVQISQTIHAHPELGFKEHRAAELLVEELRSQGFDVETGVAGLETAFRASFSGSGPGPTIALFAEYDALVGLGHACGHNLIAASALGAGISLANTAKELKGRVVVFGTPAEEGGGGKIIMARAGAFDGVDAALMMHPNNRNMVAKSSLASIRAHVEFFGKASHAIAAPEQGINALEAVIQTFVSVNGLRLHLRPDARIHGIITHGGEAANIIPAYAAARFSARSADLAYSTDVMRRVRASARGAAIATGARLKFKEIEGYANLVPNQVMTHAFTENMQALGTFVEETVGPGHVGSTDMGNVSQMIPTIHPYIAVAPKDVPTHSPGFAKAAISDRGQSAMLAAAKALAMTGADLLSSQNLMAEAKAEFQRQNAAARE